MSPKLLLRIFYWGTTVALLLPLSLIVIVSFKDGAIVSLPPGRLSLRWYGEVLHDPDMLGAAMVSARVALSSTALALLIGTWTALALRGVSGRAWRLILLAGALVPLVLPGIVHAVALRIAIARVGLDPGPGAVILGHAIHAAPYVVIMAGARLAAMPENLVEAARDLGAGSRQAFLYIILPWLGPALLGAAILSLLTSFDDFVRSFFLGGYHATLPVLIYGRLHGGLTPEINAVSSLVLVIAGGAGLLGARFLTSPRAGDDE